MLVVGTVEAGDTLFEGMSTNPFNDEIKKSTGLDCTVGVGTSYDAAAAFDAAVAALKACATQDAGHGCVVLEDGMIVSLGGGRPGGHPQPPASLGAAELRYVGQLREAFLTADSPDPEATDIEGSPIVAAEEVATVLSITPRSARRFMDSLVAAGVAWALPPVKSPQPGSTPTAVADRSSRRPLVQQLTGMGGDGPPAPALTNPRCTASFVAVGER